MNAGIGPTARPRVRDRAVLALLVIVAVGGTGAWMGVSTIRFFSASCYRKADALACTTMGQAIGVYGGVVAVAVGTILALVGLARTDQRFVTAAWSVWGGFCLVWWFLLLTL